jgi:RNA polymerase sigma factor (sigma-70 family)
VSTAESIYRNLIEPIEDRMILVIGRIVRDPDDAADALQKVLETVWRKLERIHRHPDPQGYIMQICFTKSCDALRAKGRRKSKEIPLIENQPVQDPGQGSRGVFHEKEILAKVRAAVALLPRKQGTAVLMRVLEGENYAAISRILGCSEAAARSHVSKGKSRLRDILRSWGISAA